jgi:hypothetical protein
MKGILLNEDLELRIEPQMKDGLIVSGLVVGDIGYQRARLIMEANKGEFKEAPTLGFGIDNYLRSVTEERKQEFRTELTKELKSDGLKPKVTIGDDLTKIDIDL